MRVRKRQGAKERQERAWKGDGKDMERTWKGHGTERCCTGDASTIPSAMVKDSIRNI